MNFYKRYMGDYGRDTAHLSLAEHGAYALLLDHYYSTEQPLPGELAALYRICRAFDKLEQKAVASVAAAFFPLCEDGLRHNDRADRQIPEDVRLIETARANGKKGGRPPKATQRVTETEPKKNPAGFLNGTETEPRAKTHQTPDYRQKQKQDQKTAPGGDLLAGIDPQVAADFKALRSKLRAPITATAMKGIEREAKAAGLGLEAALAMCCERGWRGFKAEWALGGKPGSAPSGAYKPMPGEV